MPEEQTPPVIDVSPEAVAAANAETVAKLEAQGRDSLPKADELARTSDALDSLRDAVVEKKTKEVDEDPPAPVALPVKEPTPEEKLAADKVTEERAAHSKRADEFFKDSPSLPAGASPRSTEAFSSIKIRAAQAIAERDTQLEEAKAKIAEYEAKLKDAVPPEITAELEDHRQWRAKLDVEADPKFKEFDKQISSAQEFIYAQLEKNPAITPAIIADIKKFGGPDNVKLDKLFTLANDPTLQRIVESKIADIEQTKWSKELAIKDTKTHIGKYLEERQKAYQDNVGAHNSETRKQFDAIAAGFSWSKEKPVDPKADEPTRKAAADHNTFAADIRKQLEDAFLDDSPRMRAVMMAATAELIFRKKDFEARGTLVESLTKELTETKAQLDKLKNASVGRLKEGGAAPGGKVDIKPKESDMFNKRSGDALDDIMRSIVEDRARKASA